MQLRPLVPADAETFASWGADEHFCRAADWAVGLAHEQRLAHHVRLATSPPPDLQRLAAVHEGHVVGYVDIQGDHPYRREIGYLVGPPSRWGRGLGLAAARAGMDHGFGLGLAEICAEALDANRASVRILQRLGMRETGRGLDAAYLGRPSHYRQFAITRREWACRSR